MESRAMAHRMIGVFVLASVSFSFLILSATSASACASGADVSTSENAIIGQADVTCSGGETEPADSSNSDSSSYYTAYKVELVCFIRAETGGQAGGCPASAPDACSPGQTLYQQYGLHDGNWEALGQFCRGDQNGAT